MLCGGSSRHRSVPSCPVACSEHCGVAASPPAPMSARVTKGPGTPCPVPPHGDHAAPCHKGPLHTLPPAPGPPPAHPKWPRVEGMPCPKCLREPSRNFSISSSHEQTLPCSAGLGQHQEPPRLPPQPPREGLGAFHRSWHGLLGTYPGPWLS